MSKKNEAEEKAYRDLYKHNWYTEYLEWKKNNKITFPFEPDPFECDKIAERAFKAGRAEGHKQKLTDMIDAYKPFKEMKQELEQLRNEIKNYEHAIKTIGEANKGDLERLTKENQSLKARVKEYHNKIEERIKRLLNDKGNPFSELGVVYAKLFYDELKNEFKEGVEGRMKVKYSTVKEFFELHFECRNKLCFFKDSIIGLKQLTRELNMLLKSTKPKELKGE